MEAQRVKRLEEARIRAEQKTEAAIPEENKLQREEEERISEIETYEKANLLD